MSWQSFQRKRESRNIKNRGWARVVCPPEDRPFRVGTDDVPTLQAASPSARVRGRGWHS